MVCLFAYGTGYAKIWYFNGSKVGKLVLAAANKRGIFKVKDLLLIGLCLSTISKYASHNQQSVVLTVKMRAIYLF